MLFFSAPISLGRPHDMHVWNTKVEAYVFRLEGIRMLIREILCNTLDIPL